MVVTQVDSPRTALTDDLLAAAAATGGKAIAARDATDALTQAWQVTPSNGLVVVAGSVYLVGKVSGLLAGGAI